jgi:hypothetical protein
MCGNGWAGAQNAAHCAKEISGKASNGTAARKRCSHKPRWILSVHGSTATEYDHQQPVFCWRWDSFQPLQYSPDTLITI